MFEEETGKHRFAWTCFAAEPKHAFVISPACSLHLCSVCFIGLTACVCIFFNVVSVVN